ncbi:MAG: WG repeat-containing protein [Bacteroidia bacterium]|nr:WG repeat-containing protein [Bacteroidia bacterium]
MRKCTFYLLIFLLVAPFFCWTQNNLVVPDLIPYRKGEKWGFANKDKKIVIPCLYDKVTPFNSHNLSIVQKNNKFYLLDKTGKIILGTEYGYISNPSEDLYMVCKERLDPQGFPEGKVGYINQQGKIVIPLIYDYAYPFSDGLAAVRKDGSTGYIDKTGKVVIPFQKYFTGGQFKDGMTWVRKLDDSNSIVLIDKTGKEYSLPPIDDYNGISDFSEGLAIIKYQEKYGAVDKTGKLVIPTNYEYLSKFSEGLAIAKLTHEASGFIDKTGKLVIPYQYKNVGEFNGGLAYVVLPSQKEGFIDKNNQLVITIPEGYNVESMLSENIIILINQNKRFSVMERKGKILLKDLSYLYVENFINGIALVELKDGNIGYIDISGKEYWEE